MKKFTASLSVKERWPKIAEVVKGKTSKECYDRFKAIVVRMKAQKTAAGKK